MKKSWKGNENILFVHVIAIVFNFFLSSLRLQKIRIDKIYDRSAVIRIQALALAALNGVNFQPLLSIFGVRD